MDNTENLDYPDAYTFINNFSALLNDTPFGNVNENDLVVVNNQTDTYKVICFSPKYDLTLLLMSVEEIEKVIQLWKNEFQSLAKNSSVKYIPIFENKGDVMDCNNSHPHVQIWFSSNIFIELAKETKQQLNSYNRYGNSLLSVHLDIELKKKEIIVLENEYFIALVPFWAIWPY